MNAPSGSLSKYRMIVEIARGGMGDVFLAVSRGPGGFHKLVVVKELRSNLSTDTEFLDMFMKEASLSARLHHPNIVQTNEVGQEGNRYFMAMEYLEGQTLNRCIQKIPREDFTTEMQLRILVDVLNGLHYAHELADYDGAPLGIVHRDISPHNVLITYDGTAKILDFGIAKTRDSAQQTATGVLKGKVPYMAPEQLDRNQDRRADIFAVGVMAWEAVAGRRLWAEKTDLGIVQALAEGKIPSLRNAKSDVPEAIERIIARALEPNSANRYATAQELAIDLEAYLETLAVRSSPKAIGRMIARTFSQEREQIRGVIDEQLKQAHSTDSQGAVEIPRLGVAQSGDLTPSGKSGSSGRTPSAGTSDLHASRTKGSEADPRRFRTLGLAVGGAALVLTIVLVGLNAAGKRNHDGTVSGATAAPPPIATSAAPAPAQVELVVTATPLGARIFVDDSPVDTNPYKAQFSKGGTHRIRAEADGFAAATETRVLDEDAVVSLALERAKADSGSRGATAPAHRPGARPQTPQNAPPSPAPAPASTPSPPSSNSHTIDPSDPYAK